LKFFDALFQLGGLDGFRAVRRFLRRFEKRVLPGDYLKRRLERCEKNEMKNGERGIDERR
jgi:hypothetical protein